MNLFIKAFQIQKFFLSEIQMNLILLIAILKLLITNTLQNLIRFGDFQNLIPPQQQNIQYFYCGPFCDGIWYSFFPIQQIQIILNYTFPGQDHRTTACNLINENYIQLCQDFNTADFGKTYQFTFDMIQHPNLQIESSSVWVILNGKVINGSNFTQTGPLFQHKVGYINITQQNNTICFQSRQVPYLQWSGTVIDNITLQIYTQKIPCNVVGCKLCILNFPNVCQVCQYLFTLQGGSCKCQSKFYLDGSICKVCLFPCETCQGQARNCLSCPKLYLLQQNQCVIADELASAASTTASIPGIEFFSIGQIFMGNLDLFWPYYSHHRAYGQQIDQILTFIHTLQNNKWFLLSLEKKIDFKFQSLNFSDYSEYSNQQYLKMESRTSYFWDGAFEIVFFSFPSMLLVFFVFNKIFYLTFEYRISRHFRPYSFLLMIYFLGIGEDISYLSFLSFNNGMNLFFFKFQDKLGNIVWIFVFFLLVFFCSGGGYFVAKFLYEKLSKHFIDGFFPKLQSFHILGYLSMKAFLIGSVNALFSTNYESLITSLVSIETVFLIQVIYLQWNNRCYKVQTFMFLQMLKSIIMIIFDISLWIDWKIRESQQEQTEKQTKKLLDFNCKALVITIIGLGALQSISMYFSGREMLNHRRKKKVVLKIQNLKSQVLKITSIKQNSQFEEEKSVKQQIKTQKNYFFQTKALEKATKTQKSEKIKIKQPFKKNLNALSIICQQDGQNQQNLEVILIDG